MRQARDIVREVHVEDIVKEYILDIVTETRRHPDVRYGPSPRASLATLNTAKARASIDGRAYVIPDDVKAYIHPLLSHRIVLHTEAEIGDVTADDVLESILTRVEPPGSTIGEGAFVASNDGGDVGPRSS